MMNKHQQPRTDKSFAETMQRLLRVKKAEIRELKDGKHKETNPDTKVARNRE